MIHFQIRMAYRVTVHGAIPPSPICLAFSSLYHRTVILSSIFSDCRMWYFLHTAIHSPRVTVQGALPPSPSGIVRLYTDCITLPSVCQEGVFTPSALDCLHTWTRLFAVRVRLALVRFRLRLPSARVPLLLSLSAVMAFPVHVSMANF